MIVEVRRGQRQVRQLRNPQPGGVEQFEHRPVAQLERRTLFGPCVQECVDFGDGQKVRQDAPEFRRFQHRSRILFDQPLLFEMAVEHFDRHETTGQRRRLHGALGVPEVQVVDNRFAFDFPEGVDAAGGKPGGVVFQIAPIGVGRIARKTAFNGEVAEKIGEIPFEHDCRRPFWMLY